MFRVLGVHVRRKETWELGGNSTSQAISYRQVAVHTPYHADRVAAPGS